MTAKRSSTRRQEILEALASELESNPGTPITTAGLARAVGISEAALYRHFPSKAKMFEALIEFAEETVFGLANRIQSEETHVLNRVEHFFKLVLGFSDRNPGITRILLGDALVGEHERLRTRVAQFYERLETQLKQFLREGVMHRQLSPDTDVSTIANMLLATAEGRMHQYMRSGFKRSPVAQWDDQWQMLIHGLFSQQPKKAAHV